MGAFPKVFGLGRLYERERDNAAHEAFYAADARRDRAEFEAAIEAFRADVHRHLRILERMRALKYAVPGGYAPPWQMHVITGVQHTIDAGRYVYDLTGIIIDETLMDYVADWVRE